jgi:hypothetical protein
VAGSLVWRTGTLIASPPGLRRNTELFLDHLDELRGRLRFRSRLFAVSLNTSKLIHKSSLQQKASVTREDI